MYMLNGCLSLCWLLFTSFHGSSIESFQSRLICVCGDNIPFHIYCMKEPDYHVMSLMSTYGTLEPIGKVSMRNWLVQGTKCQKQVTYTEVIHNHYKFRHAVDDHNAKSHSPISLEVARATKWWPNRVLAFILSVTEVNAMLAYKHFCKEEVDGMLGFRKLLAEALVCNPYYKEEEESPRRSSRLTKNAEHRVSGYPKARNFSGQILWMLTVPTAKVHV